MRLVIRYSSLLEQVPLQLSPILFLSPSFLHIFIFFVQEDLLFYSKLLSHFLTTFVIELPLLISFICILVLFLLLRQVVFEKAQVQLSFFILLVPSQVLFVQLSLTFSQEHSFSQGHSFSQEHSFSKEQLRLSFQHTFPFFQR